MRCWDCADRMRRGLGCRCARRQRMGLAPCPELWDALDGGPRLSRILDDFYARYPSWMPVVERGEGGDMARERDEEARKAS